MGTNITGIGNANAIGFKSKVTGGIYFSPELKDALVGVWSAYGKSNDSTDRNIIKNKIKDRGGDFVISNAAFKLNSGFGKYETELSNTRIWTQSKETTSSPFSSNYNGLSGWIVFANTELTNSADMPSFKIQVKGLLEGQELIYRYYDSNGQSNVYSMGKDGEYTLPADIRTAKPQTTNTSGFQVVKNDTNTITITQIPSFVGAFVTDGIDDLITSTKTVQEMLGGSNEITVVSMIHQIEANVNNLTNTNNIRIDLSFIRNSVVNVGKTGIYGYTFKNTVSLINNILGDKNDYTAQGDLTGTSAKFSVEGMIEGSTISQTSQVAWYWTFIAKKALTTDQINQVIAYYNLDKYVKPDIYYDVKKQGLTNDTPDSDWYLKDYSGNGHDMQLYNYSKTPESGINEEGGLQSDGVTDYGQYIGDLELKDYTVVVDRAYPSLKDYGVPIISGIKSGTTTPFLFEFTDNTGAVRPYSFGDTTLLSPMELNRKISYQSTYIYDGTTIIKGKQTNTGSGLTIGRFKEGQQYANIALWSLLLFPYSLSEFLLERQLKRYKLGTLYPDMVEFRPVIKSNVLLDAKPTFVIRGTSTYLNAGDYVPENSQIWVSIKMNNIADRITKFTVNGKTIDIPENAYSEVTLQYGFSFVIDKSPQKISITIEQDENYVKFEPVITSNVEYVRLNFYLNNYQKRINIGDYIPKDAYLRANLYLKNNVDELTVFTFNGVNIGYIRSSVYDTAFNINQIYNYDSPQEVNITIDEYIRFEDIVQPYPVLLRFNDENGNEVSWGGKFKVGSTITRIGSAADSNLLPNIYNIFGLLLNGNQVTSSKVIVEKTMVFKVKSAYIFDNNEPKCILSPRLLRIPNSSYKILGYIPDISGHGNHGKINNSAYAGMSGANGYKQDFTSWKTSGSSYSIVTDSKYILTNEKAITNDGYFLWNRLAKDSFKVKISNIPNGGWMSYRYKITEEDTQFSSLFIRKDGIYTLPATIADSEVDFFISTVSAPAKDWIGLTIEQIGEYEGAYCLDGVDDFVTIPTLSSGGKQMLMKVNWDKTIADAILYDQRGYPNEFAIYNADVDNNNPVFAYQARNNGQTYIDGILNKNIKASELKAITHNITITNELSTGTNTSSPVIGSNRVHDAYFTNMALYDFMLFDSISTDDKIKELNEYVGIEAKVELPPYYWDAYGKTNLDADKATIQQRGVAVGDYDLTNYNHAYEGMSGYNGYPIILSGNNRTYQDRASYVNVVGDDKNVINLTRLSFNTAAIFSYVKNNGELTSYNKDIESFKIKVTGIDYSRFVIKYNYISEANATAKTTMTIASDSIYELPKSFASDGSLTSSNVWIGINFTKQSNDIPDIIEDVNVTIEVLPEYENGLVYDGVEDFSKNANIPALDDFTAIIKREWLKKQGCPLIKGSKVYEGGNGNALLLEWNKAYNFVFYKRTDIMEGELPDNISFITPTNYNGNVITRGSEQDTNGICIAGDGNAGFANMVFYKLILYPKTIPLLQINFLKNLMERDEIIDLNNPIFIKNE